MKKIAMDTFKSSVNDPNEYQKKKTIVLLLLTTLLIFSAACSLFHSEKDESDFQQEMISMLGTQEVSEPQTTEASGFAQEPLQQPAEPQDSEVITDLSGTHEYAVTSENYSCTCKVGGNKMQELRFANDQLEVVEADGRVNTYDKIGDNTYKRSWMGYYILVVDGVDTKVDREESVVINLNEGGYTSDLYQGADSSPCCSFTFSQVN